MSDTGEQPQSSKEQRLAARLRENLRRRKAQARALGASGGHPADDTPPGQPLPKRDESG